MGTLYVSVEGFLRVVTATSLLFRRFELQLKFLLLKELAECD